MKEFRGQQQYTRSSQVAIPSYLVDLSPFLRSLVREALVNNGHDLIEQLAEGIVSIGVLKGLRSTGSLTSCVSHWQSPASGWSKRPTVHCS